MIDTVILDYGHGGIDSDGNYTTAPSKMAKVNGEWVYEGVLNRTIGGMLYHLLKWDWKRKLKVVQTVAADDPRDISLAQRVRKCNAESNAIFVSIHCNASPNGVGEGFEIFTTRGQNNSDILAECIAEEIGKLKGNNALRMRYDLTDGDLDKEADHYVTRKSIHPAVLVECLFFDNAKDLEKFNDLKFRQAFVAALYHGIVRYIDLKNND